MLEELLGEDPGTLLAYTACLVAQRVVRDRVTDLTAINLATDPGLDCFYLPEHLQSAQLGPLLRFNLDPALRNKLNPLISTLLG